MKCMRKKELMLTRSPNIGTPVNSKGSQRSFGFGKSSNVSDDYLNLQKQGSLRGKKSKKCVNGAQTEFGNNR